ncbi:MAG: RNA-directed DNA polymerase [Alphaproteobacteria bacterium]|nr:MAG: RNA-directed DNA polymerase [Alphaproteobacteria bacterium]
MTPWRSQAFRAEAIAGGGSAGVITNAVATAAALHKHTPDAPPVFTLGHLAHLTDVHYRFLRQVVERQDPERYRRFRILKRTSGAGGAPRYRIICVPDPRLMRVQRWINANVLALGHVHKASTAFKAGDNIVAAAGVHCDAKWMIKIDILNFFESVSEQSVYHVFRGLGYQPLISFELARLCTRRGESSNARRGKRWAHSVGHAKRITNYHSSVLGHLPQGAPTSPMLANLAMKGFDEAVSRLADTYDLSYTRYADDLTLSSLGLFDRSRAQTIVSEVYDQLRCWGFRPNLAKTLIVPPGARKVVLGLLVDRQVPRLTKAFRARMRRHLYFLSHPQHGPVKHAAALGFASVYGLRNHVSGLIAYAQQVDANFAADAWGKFDAIVWP